MKQVLLVILLLAGSLIAGPVALAQLTQSTRLEIPANPNEVESFDVTPLAEQGVLVTIQSGGFFSNEPVRFIYQRLNWNLKPIWYAGYKQDTKYRQIQAYHNDQYLYQLFREYDTNKYQFLRIHLGDGAIETFEGTLLDQFDIRQFKVLDSQAYVGGYHHNRPVVMVFSLFDRSTKVLPGLYANNLELSSIELDEARREVNILVHSSKRRCQFSIRTYNYESRPLRTIDFSNARNSLISGKLLPVNERESLLVGNYSTDCTPYSQGVYVTRIHHDEPATAADDAIKDMQFIEFSQLQNFFNYMKPERQQKILARAKRKKEEGKDYKFRYRLLVHDLQPTADGLTLVAEVYYPQYRGSALTNTAYTRGMDRYEGFHYTHAFICGFDKMGKLLWDNCLPIKQLLSRDLTQMVQLSQQGDRMVLAYPYEGAINMEVIQGNKILRETEKIKLGTSRENEKIMFSAQDNLMAWYGRHFLAFGFQKITSTNSTNPREVFYLNKLTYDPDQPPSGTADASIRKSVGSARE
ncbi:hypothetical protein [Spirosoma sp. KUDC1026]|uniref:hypothetical protein n=1 Tax=Spirosoma sp. KUDC1026 TaxID=2745947 RepID=UPI00159BECF5|nr:hypothetical protein [Spirosoma sp. KUDC1026]QKZ12610.1 hypothetical protein HU175_08180 [Spirosoma sp. KUDC1026]